MGGITPLSCHRVAALTDQLMKRGNNVNNAAPGYLNASLTFQMAQKIPGQIIEQFPCSGMFYRL